MGTADINFSAFFDENPVPMWVYDATTLEFLKVNNAATRCYGYSLSEFAGMTLKDIRPAEDVPALVSFVKQLDQKNSADYANRKWRHQKKDGEVFYVNIISSQILVNGKKCVLAQVLDIDERVKTDALNKQLYEVIKLHEEELNDILASINQVAWAAHAGTFDLLYINDACERVFGYTASELKNNKEIVVSCIHPDDREVFHRSMKDLLQFGRSEAEFRAYHKDGSLKYLRGNAVLKKGENGSPGICSGLTVDITQLKTTELELVAKAEETERILNSITDGFFVLDDSWRFTYVNKAVESLFGKSKSELLGSNYWEFFPRSTQQKFYSQYHRAFEENVSVHFEEYSHALDKWVNVSAYPTGNGLSVYFTDITEQKILKDKIRNDELNLRAVIDNTKDLIWSTNKELAIVTANKAFWERMECMTGKTPFEITESDFGPNVFKAWREFYQRALAGERFNVVYESVSAGVPVIEETNFNPIFDLNNNISGVTCYSRNITEERTLQNKIRQDEQNLKALINNTTHLIWSIDTQYRLVIANQPYNERIMKYAGKLPVIGESIFEEAFGKEYVERWSSHYERVLSGESFSVVEQFRDIGRDRTAYSEVSFDPILDEDGLIQGACCFATDITAQIVYSRKIAEQNKKFQEISWIQSHKVRGPVARILGLVSAIDPATPVCDDNLKILKYIHEATQELDEVIRDINERTNVLRFQNR